MKCLNCGEYITSDQTFCTNCGNVIILCPKCNDLVSKDDDFCGHCGENLKETIATALKKQKEKEQREKEAKQKELEAKQKKELEEEMKQFASNIIIDCEGNKFKAIKDFKDKYNVDNEIASEYINNAYDKINNEKGESESTNESEDNSIEAIVKRNPNDKIKAVKEVMDTYGYDLVTAKASVDNAIKGLKSSNQYVDPKGIKRTIIVSQNSRKKATSAIGRGLIGGALLGPVGLLAGASAKSKQTTTFQVIYNSGKQETVTVNNNSWLFKEYCKYLDN